MCTQYPLADASKRDGPRFLAPDTVRAATTSQTKSPQDDSRTEREEKACVHPMCVSPFSLPVFSSLYVFLSLTLILPHTHSRVVLRQLHRTSSPNPASRYTVRHSSPLLFTMLLMDFVVPAELGCCSRATLVSNARLLSCFIRARTRTHTHTRARARRPFDCSVLAIYLHDVSRSINYHNTSSMKYLICAPIPTSFRARFNYMLFYEEPASSTAVQIVVNNVRRYTIRRVLAARVHLRVNTSSTVTVAETAAETAAVFDRRCRKMRNIDGTAEEEV